MFKDFFWNVDGAIDLIWSLELPMFGDLGCLTVEIICLFKLLSTVCYYMVLEPRMHAMMYSRSTCCVLPLFADHNSSTCQGDTNSIEIKNYVRIIATTCKQ